MACLYSSSPFVGLPETEAESCSRQMVKALSLANISFFLGIPNFSALFVKEIGKGGVYYIRKGKNEEICGQ